MPRRVTLPAILTFFLFGALLTLGTLSAQTRKPEAAPDVDVLDVARPGFRIFTDREGVPQNAVTVLRRDQRGYVWAGTKGGVAYYNGRSWNTVRLPPRIGSVWIHSIAPASDGSIWLSTLGGGVLRLMDGEWTTFTAANSALPHDNVFCIGEAQWSGGRTMVVATERGVARFENGAWVRLTPIPRDPDRSAHVVFESVEEDGTKALWVGMNVATVARLQSETWTVYELRAGSEYPGAVTGILRTRALDGTPRMVVSARFGPHVLRGDRWEPLTDPKTDIGEDPRCLTETINPDGTAVMWVGGTGGLWRCERGLWTHYAVQDGLPFMSVWSLLETGREGGSSTLWIGTGGGGIAVWEQGKWMTIGTGEGLRDQSIYSLLETVSPEGRTVYWVGTNLGGLSRLENGRWTTFTRGEGELPSDTIYSIAETQPGSPEAAIWAGTLNGGLARYRGGRWTAYRVSDGLPDDRVNALLETTWPDGIRKLLVGTNRGLAFLDESATPPVNPAKTLLSGVAIRSLLETRARDGRRIVWAGTNKGLVRFDGGVRVFDSTSGLPTDSVLNVQEVRMPDGRTTIWAGTEGGGVAWMDPEADEPVWEALSERSVPALPNNVVYRVQQDRLDRIYLFTNRGVARLTPRVPSDGESAPFDLYTFTIDDGLPSNECNTGASLLDSRGRIWAGTIAGVAVFDPQREYLQARPYPLQIERVLTDGAERRLSDGAELEYRDNSLTFEFVLLSFFRETDTVYRTQLVGFDPNPSDWTNDYSRTYTNLPAGTYTFEVWGRDPRGVVAGPARMRFTVLPAPWQTWWAYGLYGLCLAGIVYAGVRYRERALRRRNEELEERIAHRTSELVHSEQRALESERRAIQANLAKSVFLSNMSHELRTPLNAVIGFAQLMERNPSLSTDQRENLEIIQRGGEHLLELINDVLSISKIEAGQITLVEQPFDLRRLVAMVLDMMRVRAEAKGLVLASDIQPSLPSAVLGDENKLRQVLINLMGNAVKFTSEGRVSLHVRWQDSRAWFSIEDTGHGIASEELPHLFEAFAQTESGRQSGEGTGLGLTISRSFVRLMGGDITVESELGKGSQFSFDIRLPQSGKETSLAERPRVVGLEDGQPRWRVLIADDIAENRLLLMKLLRAVGFDVREAFDGAEAVAIWTEWRPHVIWMDMRMPVMNGMEATRRIREEEARSDSVPPRTVIIALTASAFEHEREEILASGCDDFVTKPFREEEIFEGLAALLGVRFRYAGERASVQGTGGAVITRERLAAIPDALAATLFDALQKGRIDEATDVAGRIREVDETLGADLIREIRAYRIDELLSTLETLQSGIE